MDDQTERLISNAVTAKEAVKTQWGKNYWDIVIAHLIRQTTRMH